MEMNENAINVQAIIESVPLQEVLDIAESVAPLIPPPAGTVVSIIIKIANVLLTIKPVASKEAGAIAQRSENDIAVKRETFNRMWEIALSNNVITTEEKEFLRPYAIDAGISDAEFEFMVMKKARINQ